MTSTNIYGVYCPANNCVGLYTDQTSAGNSCTQLNNTQKNLVYFQNNQTAIISQILSSPIICQNILTQLGLYNQAQQTTLPSGSSYTVQTKSMS